MEKTLTLKITEDEHRKIKILSAEEGKSIKGFIMGLIKSYISNREEDDLLTEDDFKDIRLAEKEYREGKCQSLEEVIEEIDGGYNCK